LRSRSTPPVWSIAPMRPACTARSGGPPKTATEPSSGCCRPRSMSTVVVLPAPFGPSRATVSPGCTETSTPRTAGTGPVGERYVFFRPRSSIPFPFPGSGFIGISP
jgi:hypothetical protein